MSPVARHHHYIPQFFLGGFTATGRSDSQLTVIDIARNNCFRTIPRNIGGVRDFNRIEVEGLEPDAFETAMASVEGQFAQALRNISETDTFDGEDKVSVLNLMALLAVRSPEQRELMRDFYSRVSSVTMGLVLRSRESWDAQLERMRADGIDIPSDVSYEQMLSFVSRGAYDIHVPTETHLNNEMEMFQTVLDLLNHRHWQLVIGTEDCGPLVTTDRPVVLTRKNAEELPPVYRNSPGYGSPNTLIIFPLSKELALIGDFDGTDTIINGSEELVRSINSTMLTHAYKQVYTPDLTCMYIRNDGSRFDGTQVLADLGIDPP